MTVLAKLTNIDMTNQDWKCEKAYQDTVTVRGFNPITGLPRAPALAIRRGSTIQITGNNLTALYEKLEEKLDTGLGERPWEGFGRFRLEPISFTNKDPVTGEHKARDIGTQEDLLSKAKALATATFKLETDKKKVTKTQWQYLRQKASIAQTLDDFYRKRSHSQKPGFIVELEEHQDKKAGAAWCGVLPKIKDELSKISSLEDKKFFLDALVRYQLPKFKVKDNKEERAANE